MLANEARGYRVSLNNLKKIRYKIDLAAKVVKLFK